MSRIIYGLLYGGIWLITLPPLSFLYIFSPFFYFILYHIFKYRRAIVTENLQNAFPDKTAEEINKITRKFYHQLADLFIEIPKTIHFNEKRLARHVVLENQEILKKYFDEGKSVIGITGHYCNWEWGHAVFKGLDCTPLIVYKRVKNKYFDRLFNDIRKIGKTRLVPMKESYRKIVLEKYDAPSLSVLIADQIPHADQINFWIRFLNQDTAYFLGPEKIAKRTNRPVVFFKPDKIRKGKYKISVVEICRDPEQTEEFEITRKHAQLLEDSIREKPHLWLWSHRRWKYKKEQ